MSDLTPHQAADDLRTVAQLIDDGLPIPIGITPRYIAGMFPVRVNVQPQHVEVWRAALDLPEMEWECPAGIPELTGQEHGAAERDGWRLVSVRSVEAAVA